jgi:hypothetical protein
MRIVFYRDRPAALVTDEAARLLPEIENLEPFDRVRRFVCALCVIAMEHERGVLGGRFDQGRVERLARAHLMPADQFACATDLDDEDLALLFDVPVEQARSRREELSGGDPPRAQTRALGRPRRGAH